MTCRHITCGCTAVCRVVSQQPARLLCRDWRAGHSVSEVESGDQLAVGRASPDYPEPGHCQQCGACWSASSGACLSPQSDAPCTCSNTPTAAMHRPTYCIVCGDCSLRARSRRAGTTLPSEKGAACAVASLSPHFLPLHPPPTTTISSQGH